MLDRLTIERMEAAAHGGPVLVAYSGGGDSTALLLLLIERFGAARLHAGIVDHAIRLGSADDAKRARAFAQEQHVQTEIVTLSWPEGANRSQQSARRMRYIALCNRARQIGASVIALGHTADDQAETVLMRGAAGSTWRGLAGMAPIAPAPVWPEGRGVRVGRPMLAARRQEMRAFLRVRGADWIEDPANANTAYERVRVRERLKVLSENNFDSGRLALLAARLRRFVEQIDRDAATLIAQAACFADDVVRVDLQLWGGDIAVRQRALSVLIAAASGEPREPAFDSVERLERRLCNADFRGASLGGAQISINGIELKIARDTGALLGRTDGAQGLAPLRLPAGVETIWDGRLALTASTPGIAVYADASTPRFDPPGAVQQCWLLSERVRHTLDPATNEINVPKA